MLGASCASILLVIELDYQISSFDSRLETEMSKSYLVHFEKHIQFTAKSLGFLIYILMVSSGSCLDAKINLVGMQAMHMIGRKLIGRFCSTPLPHFFFSRSHISLRCYFYES